MPNTKHASFERLRAIAERSVDRYAEWRKRVDAGEALPRFKPTDEEWDAIEELKRRRRASPAVIELAIDEYDEIRELLDQAKDAKGVVKAALREHDREAGRDPGRKTCAECGEEFPLRGAREDTRYCTPRCKDRAKKRRRQKR